MKILIVIITLLLATNLLAQDIDILITNSNESKTIYVTELKTPEDMVKDYLDITRPNEAQVWDLYEFGEDRDIWIQTEDDNIFLDIHKNYDLDNYFEDVKTWREIK